MAGAVRQIRPDRHHGGEIGCKLRFADARMTGEQRELAEGQAAAP